MRRFFSVIAGLAAGFLAVAAIEWVSTQIYTPPTDLDWEDRDAVSAFVSQLPIGAMLLVLLAHAAGALLGGLACNAVAGGRWIVGSLIVGAILLAAGVVNLVTIPHPIWFGVVDVLLYLPAAWLGGFVVSTQGREANVQAKPA